MTTEAKSPFLVWSRAAIGAGFVSALVLLGCADDAETTSDPGRDPACVAAATDRAGPRVEPDREWTDPAHAPRCRPPTLVRGDAGVMPVATEAAPGSRRADPPDAAAS